MSFRVRVRVPLSALLLPTYTLLSPLLYLSSVVHVLSASVYALSASGHIIFCHYVCPNVYLNYSDLYARTRYIITSYLVNSS